MKQILCITLCLFALTCSAQRQKYNWKRAIAPASLSFASGASWGVHEATMHHWSSVQAKYPSLPARWWNPAASWKNKYVNGDPAQGRRKFAGVFIPAHLTDSKHMLASFSFTTIMGAGVLIGINEKRPWWFYLFDLGISFAAYSAGNYLTYNIIMR